MKAPEIECIDISDVHLGHPHTHTDRIIERLDRMLTELFKTKRRRFLFVSGDFFDRLLNVPSSPIKHIQTYIVHLLRQCKAYNVKLRVLEGTPSHDWKQNYLFIQLNEDAQIHADVRYYDSLSIDYEEEEGLYILYVPDEWDEDTKETERQVASLLEEKGLQQVDLAIMHGMFAFQVPENLHKHLPLHDQTVYEQWVKSLIVIGHHHRHRSNGKVVVPGSFDRLAHGEEEPKGLITFTLKPKGTVNVTFHENQEAEQYLSVPLEEDSAEAALEKLHSTLPDLPPFTKVRLVYPEHHPISAYLAELVKQYPEIVWSKPKVIKAEKKIEVSEVLKLQYEAVVLRQDNIEDKLIEEMSSRFPEADTEQARSLIRKVIQNV